MSDAWERSGIETEVVEDGREFLGPAELFVTNTAGAALRKPPNPRKKPDKRDAAKQLNLADDKKIKEQFSWLTSGKGPAGGHWRPATCKLSEEGERCLLNIYVDESILYQTIYIHLLNHTDIRHADTSLFLRKNCLSIYCATGKRWAPANTFEPVYLHFASLDACNAWMVLLRSYALPEIYGRWFFPDDGGSYRMWRQVELTIMQGRNLGNAKPLDSRDSLSEGSDTSEPDPVDIDVFCDIKLNKTLCGRTTTKKGIGSPDWHEAFTFSELPPFENLEVVVLREKKLFRPPLGLVRIPLSNFRRGEAVEGWFPVLHSSPGSIASDLQMGEIRLKIRVDEDYPSIQVLCQINEGMLLTFRTKNFLDWMSDFESKLKLKSIGTPLMVLAVANDRLIDQVQEIARREVDGSVASRQTLFRGNTILTKVIEQCMSFYGKTFLEASIGSVLRRLCNEKVAIEVDPMRSRKSTKDVERNVELLIHWCQEFWNQIYSVRDECPFEMRQIFGAVRELVEKRFANSAPTLDHNKDLPWQSVSAFCFLRFIVPAILHPHLFGLTPGLPSLPVQRSLTLIAKVIQSMANLNANVQKEEFMRGVKDFLQDSRPAMIDYLVVVSKPSKDLRYAKVPDRPRTNVANIVREREAEMPVLYQESIPVLPHMLDISRHLAVITSAVIRSSRAYRETKTGQTIDKSLEEFCVRCFDVEEQALQRVSQLAAQLSASHRRPFASVDWTSHSPASALGSSPSESDPPKSPRPSTAPSDGDPNKRRMLLHQSSASSSSPDPAGQTNRLVHIRSPSDDSISSADPLKGDVGNEDDAKAKKGLLRLWRR
ncbi:hypothetical protein D9758_000282 [Tetrapyrgos nigripes]|uniref:Rho GTPase activation protein n=1 Tax=Tetrapyrgos nigripes TaxID=182062 RepID=A0A8H5H136_9AGAR|nr:hypothetical protein D9758_000282 [Tetrapyrgos nigripes]